MYYLSDEFFQTPISSLVVDDLVMLFLSLFLVFVLIDLFLTLAYKFFKRPLRRLYRKVKKFLIRKFSALAVKRGI